METVEVAIYLTISVLIGILIIGFLRGWVQPEPQEGPPDSIQVNIEGFIGESIKVWNECGKGKVDMARSFYITEIGTLDKNLFFEKVKELNMCNSLQSLQYDCGTREDIVFVGGITTPDIVRAACDDEKLVIG